MAPYKLLIRHYITILGKMQVKIDKKYTGVQKIALETYKK
jgi:hypothetical protein